MHNITINGQTATFTTNIQNPAIPIRDLSSDQALGVSSTTLGSNDVIVPLNGAFEVAFRQASARFDIVVVNEKNPGIDQRLEGDGFAPSPFREYPWRYENGDVAVCYELVGTVSKGIRTRHIPLVGGISGRFGLEKESEVRAVFLRLHGDGSKSVDTAVSEDLGGVPNRFLDPTSWKSVWELDPKNEYLMFETQSAASATATFTWGQVFRANPGFLRALVPPGQILKSRGSLQAKVIVEAAVETTTASKFQVITHRRNENTARIEFRTAKKDSLGLSLGAEVSARLLDRRDAEAALTNLFGMILPSFDGTIEDLRRRLGQLENGLNLPNLLGDQLLSEFTSFGRALSLDEHLNALLAPLRRLDGVVEELEKEMTGAGFSDQGRKDLYQKIENFLDGFTVDSLENELKTELSPVLAISEYAQIPLAAFPRLLGVTEFREQLLTQVPNLEVDKLIDGLRESIDAGFRTLSPTDEIEEFLNRFLEAKTLRAADLLSLFSMNSVLQSALSIGSSEVQDWLDSLIRKIDATPWVGSLGDLDGLIRQLCARFGDTAEQLQKRIDELAEKLERALTTTAVFSACSEIAWESSEDALLSFDFVGLQDQNPVSKQLFSRAYDSLLVGDLESVIKDSDAPQYKDVYRYISEKIGKRRSSFFDWIFFGKGGFSEELLSETQRIRELRSGGASETAQVVLTESGFSEYGPLLLRGRRELRQATIAQSSTEKHPASEFLNATHFSTASNFSFQHSGKVQKNQPSFGLFSSALKREKVMNLRAIVFLLGELEFHGGSLRTDWGKISQFLDGLADAKSEASLRVSLEIDFESFAKLLKKNKTGSGNFACKLGDSFKSIWDKTEVPGEKALWPNDSVRGESGDYLHVFKSLRKLADCHDSTTTSQAEFQRALHQFSKGVFDATNRNKNAPVFSFCYVSSVLQSVSELELEGTVSAVLSSPDNEILIA